MVNEVNGPEDFVKPGSWRDFSRANTRRSLALMSFGALLGLGLAGYSLFTARSASTLFVPVDAVALVNQQPLSRSDYLSQLQTLYGVNLSEASAQQKRKVLNDMIREELFVQRGKELDVASSDPDVRSALVNAVELEISQNAVTSQPSETALRRCYVRNLGKYMSEGTMNVHDMVFGGGESGDLAAQLAPLKPMLLAPGTLERLNGRDSGRTSGDEFYFAAKIHLGAQLFNLARELEDGALSNPVAQPDGLHVLYMIKNKRPLQLEFDVARPQVLNDFRAESINRLQAGDEAFLRKRANVLIADDLR